MVTHPVSSECGTVKGPGFGRRFAHAGALAVFQRARGPNRSPLLFRLPFRVYSPSFRSAPLGGPCSRKPSASGVQAACGRPRWLPCSVRRESPSGPKRCSLCARWSGLSYQLRCTAPASSVHFEPFRPKAPPGCTVCPHFSTWRYGTFTALATSLRPPPARASWC